MMDWLRIYDLADVIPSIEALEKTQKQYYPNEIDMLKDAVSVPGISMNYVLNKALKTKKPDEPSLYTLGQPCIHTCENCLGLCKECKQVKTNCTHCMKNKPCELLRISMVGGPSIIFCLYTEAGKSQTWDHQYHNADLCQLHGL